MKWRYGVRGAIKPPLGCWYLHREQTLVGQIENLCYRWRHLCWRADSWLYQRTGLPEDWHRWMREPNQPQSATRGGQSLDSTKKAEPACWL